MYFLIGLIIILLIVIIYFFVFPGIFIIKSNSISGYWTDLYGNIYYINSTGLYSFTIIHKNIIQNGIIQGTIFNNRICISDNKIMQKKTNNYCGQYNIQTNSIKYNNGIEWYKAQF
jgi:hypothetical protein